MGIFAVVFKCVVVVETGGAGLEDEEEVVVVAVGVDVAPRAAAIFSILRFQTLTVGFACAATIFSALTASIWPWIFFSAPSDGGDGDDERVVASVTDEFGVPSALVDTDDTAADDTAVLAVDTAKLALGLVSTSTGAADADAGADDAGADGRWWGTTGGGGGAAMGDRMFCALRARSA